MSGRSKQLTQKTIAILVIVALLHLIGLSTAVVIFLLIVGFLVWRAVQYSDTRETERIFDFYIAADEILRDEERQWYGFEVAEVINSGERILNSMADPPPLTYFALGALYYRIGDYHEAAEQLSILEDGFSGERYRTVASEQLRRYVETLRNIERDPTLAPKTLSAIRSLERGRRKRAAELLSQSRDLLDHESVELNSKRTTETYPATAELPKVPTTKPVSPVSAPRPIAEVLHDVYQEDKKTA